MAEDRTNKSIHMGPEDSERLALLLEEFAANLRSKKETVRQASLKVFNDPVFPSTACLRKVELAVWFNKPPTLGA